MHVHFEGAFRLSCRSRRLLERKLAESEDFDGFSLSWRELLDRLFDRVVLPLQGCIPVVVRVDVGEVFEIERGENFTSVLSTAMAQGVYRASLRDRAKPSRETAGGIISLQRAMNGEKDLLDHIVDPIRVYALASNDAANQRHAVPQQPFIGRFISGLSRRHKPRPLRIDLCGFWRRTVLHRPFVKMVKGV